VNPGRPLIREFVCACLLLRIQIGALSREVRVTSLLHVILLRPSIHLWIPDTSFERMEDNLFSSPARGLANKFDSHCNAFTLIHLTGISTRRGAWRTTVEWSRQKIVLAVDRGSTPCSRITRVQGYRFFYAALSWT
jgi:hypothetical protein